MFRLGICLAIVAAALIAAGCDASPPPPAPAPMPAGDLLGPSTIEPIVIPDPPPAIPLAPEVQPALPVAPAPQPAFPVEAAPLPVSPALP